MSYASYKWLLKDSESLQIKPLFANSFIPSSVSLWNNLPHEPETLQSISLFKSKIIQSFNISKVPAYHLCM